MSETFDFGDGPVPAHRHKNPDGSVGGWVADTARVSGNAEVYSRDVQRQFYDAIIKEIKRVRQEPRPIRKEGST